MCSRNMFALNYYTRLWDASYLLLTAFFPKYFVTLNIKQNFDTGLPFSNSDQKKKNSQWNIEEKLVKVTLKYHIFLDLS